MIKRRSVLLYSLALACGLAAAWFAHNWIQTQTTPARAAGLATTPILVAAFDLDYGERIQASSLKTLAWPTDSIPEGVLREPTAAVGKVANQTILRGEPVTSRRLVDQVGGSTLASMITPEKRAVTVRVNDVIGVAGFLLPGNRVDVLATRMTRDRRADTRTVLQNMRVLAVDQRASPDASKPVLVRAVTLEADPEEATILVKATEEGTVQLALRNPADSSLVAEKEAQKPKVKRVYVPRPESQTVTVIRGTTTDISKARF